MRKTIFLFLGAALWAVYPADLKFSPSQGWKSLLRPDLNGWRGLDPAKPNEWEAVASVGLLEANPKLFAMAPLPAGGGGIVVNGKAGKTVNLITVEPHGDVEAYVEFTVLQGSNSGVYFQGRYEVQILDSHQKKDLAFSDCGGIYARYIDQKVVGGAPPRVNASRAPGEWQSFHVWFRAPRFDAAGRKTENARFVKVVHNGVTIHENVEVEGPTRASMTTPEGPAGPLMLQGDHGPVAFRQIYLRKLP